jgi:hypothetical protein
VLHVAHGAPRLGALCRVEVFVDPIEPVSGVEVADRRQLDSGHRGDEGLHRCPPEDDRLRKASALQMDRAMVPMRTTGPTVLPARKYSTVWCWVFFAPFRDRYATTRP